MTRPLEPAENIYSYGEKPRAKPSRYRGEPPPPEATQRLPGPERPETMPNPMDAAREPTTLLPPKIIVEPIRNSELQGRPRERPEDRYHWRDNLIVRPVNEADIAEMLPKVWPRIQEIYPRCTEESLLPYLRAALGNNRFRFLRTKSAVGLYLCERTPWEPGLTVYGNFLVSIGRRTDDPDDGSGKYGYSLTAGAQPMAILEAAYKWAQEIGAEWFLFGAETKYDVTPFARRLGYDHETHGFAKRVTKEPIKELRKLGYSKVSTA